MVCSDAQQRNAVAALRCMLCSVVYALLASPAHFPSCPPPARRRVAVGWTAAPTVEVENTHNASSHTLVSVRSIVDDPRLPSASTSSASNVPSLLVTRGVPLSARGA
jgi:hypothetical protein